MDSRSRNESRKQKDRDDRDNRKHRSRSRSPAAARSHERRSRSPGSDHRSGDRRDASNRRSNDYRKGEKVRGINSDQSRRRHRSKSEEGEIDDASPERDSERHSATKSAVIARRASEQRLLGITTNTANKTATQSTDRRPQQENVSRTQPQVDAPRSGMAKRTDYLEGYSRWLDSETESESEEEAGVGEPVLSVGPHEDDPDVEVAGEAETDITDKATDGGDKGAESDAEGDAVKDVDATQDDESAAALAAAGDANRVRENIYYPALYGCRSVNEYDLLNRIEEGTYGVVYRARDKKRGEMVALKRLKMEKEKEGFPITSLREINTLLKAQHENIVTVREIVVGSNMDRIYVVMDFADHDLRNLMESMRSDQRFTLGEVKSLLSQLLAAVAHMHDNWILHRDLKTSNLLLTNRGVLKVGDFGLAREYGSPLKPLTPVVVTLWYRAPELLLGAPRYSTQIDIWSVGCIFSELLLYRPLWSGKSENEQLALIFRDLGTPSERIWPDCTSLPLWNKLQLPHYAYNQLRNRFARNLLTDAGWNLLNRLFAYDPSKRISAVDARKHEYFTESPQPTDPSMFRTWPSRSESTHTAPRPVHALASQPMASAVPSAQGLAMAARRAVDEVLARKKRDTPPPPVAGVGAQNQLLGKDDDF